MRSLTDLGEVVDVVIGVAPTVHTHSILTPRRSLTAGPAGGVLGEITVASTAFESPIERWGRERLSAVSSLPAAWVTVQDPAFPDAAHQRDEGEWLYPEAITGTHGRGF